MITPRDVQALATIARYYVVNREQLQRTVFTDDESGRVTRRRLQVLVDAGLSHRHTLFAYHPTLGSPSPVYYPSQKGAEFLADHFEADSFRTINTQPPQPNLLLHWLALTDTHIAIEQAIARQTEVTLDGWINEFDIANKAESLPEKRYKLYVLVRPMPRDTCGEESHRAVRRKYLFSAVGVATLDEINATSGMSLPAQRGANHSRFSSIFVLIPRISASMSSNSRFRLFAIK